MNQLAKLDSQSVTDDEAIRVLSNSLYPGANPESVRLVLSYCRMNGIDPMLKSVHIVPVWNSKSGKTEDVLMPGIADYRIKAARTGEYAGKSEPEFGPDVTGQLGGTTVTYPAWCRMTISRIVAGQPRAFVATERWLENYATAKRDSDAPNRMWKKRPYGQLAKCAEAQALRMAFPEFSGGQPTAEEMEGKDFAGTTIEAAPQRVNDTATARALGDSIPHLDEDPPAPKRKPTVSEWLDVLDANLKNSQTADQVDALIAGQDVQKALDTLRNGALDRLNTMVKAALDRTAPPESDGDAFPGDLPSREEAA